ncbi:hypothetical protein MRX96_015133 [Rhipicephalus microplus]
MHEDRLPGGRVAASLTLWAAVPTGAVGRAPLSVFIPRRPANLRRGDLSSPSLLSRHGQQGMKLRAATQSIDTLLRLSRPNGLASAVAIAA